MRNSITTCLAAALIAGGYSSAEETSPDISGLEAAASKFIIAFTEKDAEAISMLFTEDGELSDTTGENLISGREAIKARYEAIFSSDETPGIAIEVDSVRLVAPNLAIEDGTVHLTPPEENAPPRSLKYAATLLKNDDGEWLIASSRDLTDATDATGELFELSKTLNGDWTCYVGDVRLDLAIGWEESGKFLIGEMLTTTPDAEPQTGTMRFGWNAARNSITSWMFDSRGGTRQSLWTPTEEGWLIRSEGTTADGETVAAVQTLVQESDEVLVWASKHRVIDGVAQGGSSLRLVRRPPVPSVD